MNIASVWEFEARVQDLLDAGTDPLDDCMVLAWLEDHPDQLDGFVSLIAGAAILEAAPERAAASTVRRGIRITLRSAAAAAVVALSTWLLWPEAPVVDLGHEARADVESPPRVVHAEIAVAHWTPTEVTVACSIGDARPTVRTEQFAPAPDATLASGVPPRGIVAASTVYVTN